MRMSSFNEEIYRVMKGTNRIRTAARFAVAIVVLLVLVEEVEHAKRRSLGLNA
jgi:hypothetical protein